MKLFILGEGIIFSALAGPWISSQSCMLRSAKLHYCGSHFGLDFKDRNLMKVSIFKHAFANADVASVGS